MKLSESQRWTIINALRNSAAAMEQGALESRNDNLMQMFLAHRDQYRFLAALVEQEEYIEIGDPA